jgi:hypothetical protein
VITPVFYYGPYLFAVLILYIVMANTKQDSEEHTPDAPTLPPAIRKSMAVRERITQAPDLREHFARWADRLEIEQLCTDVEEGRKP